MADLMFDLGPIHLRGEPVGHPEVGTVFAEKFLDHGPAAIAMNDEAGAIAVMEHPSPPGCLADARAGLVRLQDGAGQQLVADQAGLPRERKLAVVEHVDERAFADVEPQKIGEQTRKPLKRDRLGEAQIDGKSPQVRPERRTRLQAGRRRRHERLAAARAGAAVQYHARHVWLDLGNLDPVVAANRSLRDACDIRPAMLTVARQNRAVPGRVRMQRPMRPGMRL
jgi:hypothetical protein